MRVLSYGEYKTSRDYGLKLKSQQNVNHITGQTRKRGREAIDASSVTGCIQRTGTYLSLVENTPTLRMLLL